MTEQTLKITILGCGSSGGVPRVGGQGGGQEGGGEWGTCDPAEPRNKRMRCSILVEQWQGAAGDMPEEADRTVVIIDTSPDLRQQLLSTSTQHLDAILYTHDHADQTHGIDDVRAIAYGMRAQIPVYMDAHTKANLYSRFKYCFEMPEGRVHPPILKLQKIFTPGDVIGIDGPGGTIRAEVLGLSHGPTPANGFILGGGVAYTPDVWDLGADAFDRLSGIKTWIVDALRYNEHPTHAHLDKTFAWLARANAGRGILTNLHIDMDYQTLTTELPGPHKAAYDGMELIFEGA